MKTQTLGCGHAYQPVQPKNACRFLVIFTLAILCWGSSPNLQAETSSLGMTNATTQHGFTFDIRIDSVPGSGYQPVTLNFRPQGKAFARQRNLTVRIRPHDYAVTEIDYSFETSISLPEKANQASKACFIPYYYPWQDVGIQLLEDGRPLKDCNWTFPLQSPRNLPLPHVKIGVVISSVGAGTPASTTPPAWQICPDTRSLQTVFSGPLPEDASTSRLSHNAAMAELQRIQPGKVQFRLLDFNDLYSSWLGYSQLDVVLIAAPYLQRLESHPQPYTALTDWVASGGTLWVYATEQADATLLNEVPFSNITNSVVPKSRNLEGSLNLSEDNDTNTWRYTYWGDPEKEESYSQTSNLNGVVVSLNSTSGLPLPLRQKVYDKLSEAKHPFVLQRKPGEITQLIRTAAFGLGRIVAIDQEAPFPESYQFWQTVQRATDAERLKQDNRTGRKLDEGSQTYWNFLLRSVGQPPVKTFVILNTIFVLLIGPFFYAYLRRKERLFLLFFVAPAAATLVTLGIGFYALVADGVQTRGRVYQLTWVDPHSDYLHTQSRQTYYAVLDSRKGLKFDDQIAIYPVLNRDIHQSYRNHSQNNSAVSQRLIQENDDTRYRGIFLPPRSQSQLLAIEPRRLPNTLTIKNDAKAFEVTNHFPFDLHHFTAKDNWGQLWRAADPIPAGATISLKAIPDKDYSLPMLESDPLSSKSQADAPIWRYSRGQSGATALERTWSTWLTRLPDGHFFAARTDLDPQFLGAENVDWQNRTNILMGPLP